MLDALKRIWRCLDRRLFFLICAMVIPINLLAILFSDIAMQESRERVRLSVTSEFEGLVNRENGKLQGVEDWYQEYISAHLRRLVSPSGFSSVYSISLANQMGSELKQQSVAGISFVWEHDGEEKLYIKSNTEQVGLKESPAFKEALRQTVSRGSGICYIQECCYFCKLFVFQNYSIGYLVNLEQEMKKWETSLLSDCNIYFSADNTSAVSTDHGKIVPTDKLNEDAVLQMVSMGEMKVSLLQPDIMKRMPPAYIILQAIAWGSIALLAALWVMIRRQVILPLKVLQAGMTELEQNVKFRITKNSSTEDFTYLYRTFNNMAEQIQKSHETEIVLYQTQLNNLKLQVNPHMLLNSLTTIYSMAETKQFSLIQKFSMNLVEYFRYCLRENNSLVPLSSELKFVQSYVELQKMRFPGELSNTYLVQDNLENAQVPPLLIQNFVENAAKYARIADKTIEIIIGIYRENKFMRIDIEDTGKGMDSEVMARLNTDELYTDPDGMQHIGVWNCRRRLKAFFGDDTSITLRAREGGGTRVEIKLPIRFSGEAAL